MVDAKNLGIRRSISGVRGTENALGAGEVARYARAFSTYLRGISNTNTVLVGRDTRSTSAVFGGHVVEALLAGGWDVIDLGCVPTPTVQLAVAHFDAAGGVMVTASHNPVEYNGLKFVQHAEGHGMFLRRDQIEAVFAIHDGGKFDARRPGQCRPVAELASTFDTPAYTAEYLARTRSSLTVDNAAILDYHLHRVISVMGKDLDVIRARSFNVAMDCCGGAGSPIDYVFLDYLYAQIKRVNEAPGVFTRSIEPTPKNLAGLCAELACDPIVYDVGFVTDCDNDRCVLIGRDPVSGDYVPLEEDYTFAVAVDQVLGQAEPGRTVVTNWSTSQMVKDICRTHHANLRRVPTGEVYTASDALHFCAAMAGEGSCAGVIDPRVGMGRDILVAMWHTLAALAYRRQPLMAIKEAYPKYYKVNQDHRTARTIEETQALIERLQRDFADMPNLAFLSREDGLIAAFQDHARVQVRASNTEPLLRVRSMAQSQVRADALMAATLAAIETA